MGYTARTIAQIQAQIQQIIAANSTLSALTSTSQTAYWNLWTFIQATSTNLMEQIMSIFFSEIESIVAESVPGTAPWIQNEVSKFQYSLTNPQVVQVNNDFTVTYPIVDVTLQIISQCAVVSNGSGLIAIKVATGSPPAPLDGAPGNSGSQVASLSGYLQTILPAGSNFNIINQNADTLQVNAIIYYNAQYNSAIQANVIAALNDYMISLPFNGVIKVSAIEQIILSVSGVIDVTLTTVICTSGSTTITLVSASTVLAREYQTVSGYIINASSPNDFANTLTFTIAAQ